MNEARHTPGPWTAIDLDGKIFPSVQIGPNLPYRDKSGLVPNRIVINIGGTPESIEKGTYQTTMDTCQANAHLIAAAPNLLEVCKTARQLAVIASDWNLDEVEIDGEMIPIYDLIEMFELAIERALGK